MGRTPPERGIKGSSSLGVGARLLLAQGLVVTAGVLTAIAVAAIAGPSLFYHHLAQWQTPPDADGLAHIATAYYDAGAIALTAALVIALLLAFAVTWYLTRQITKPLSSLASVADRLSTGDYAARATDFSGGRELNRLSRTFNELAERLQVTEDTRRRLLTDLSHEMRTPLATLQAYLDGMDDGVTSWGPDTARVLRDQTNRLVRLATDLGDVSRAEESLLEVALVPVEDLIGTAADGVRADYAAKGVALDALTAGAGPMRAGSAASSLLVASPASSRTAESTSVTAPSGAVTSSGLTVLADQERILQALTNLLTNALRHTASGGSVRVTAVAVRSAVRIEVVDTGEGISPEQLPHVFERFYRGDSARNHDHAGSGIGLTIAQRIAAAHGGSLTANSAGLGYGATFRLMLPAPTSKSPR